MVVDERVLAAQRGLAPGRARPKQGVGGLGRGRRQLGLEAGGLDPVGLGDTLATYLEDNRGVVLAPGAFVNGFELTPPADE